MTEYSLLLLTSFIVPFVFSFEKQIHFIKKFSLVLKSILVIGIPYIIWDAIFAHHKVWGFSKEKASDFRLFHLPIEEILFFFVVPYALLFIFEVISFYIKEKELKFKLEWFLSFSILFLILAALAYPKVYTTLQMFVTAFLFFLVWIKKLKIFNSKVFWIYTLVSFIPFLVVNYFLTSIPIVWYDNTQNLGIRIITIPVEDFFYHFSYSTLIVIAYTFFRERR